MAKDHTVSKSNWLQHSTLLWLIMSQQFCSTDMTLFSGHLLTFQQCSFAPPACTKNSIDTGPLQKSLVRQCRKNIFLLFNVGKGQLLPLLLHFFSPSDSNSSSKERKAFHTPNRVQRRSLPKHINLQNPEGQLLHKKFKRVNWPHLHLPPSFSHNSSLSLPLSLPWPQLPPEPTAPPPLGSRPQLQAAAQLPGLASRPPWAAQPQRERTGGGGVD